MCTFVEFPHHSVRRRIIDSLRYTMKRRLILKLSGALLIIICAVPFFLSKPKGQEGHAKDRLKAEKQAKVFRNVAETHQRTGAVFTYKKPGNFEPKNVEKRTGPGEEGKAHYLSSDKKNEMDQGMMEFGINVVASDEISMNRSIPDFRIKECSHWDYPADLPKTSVIIVFHNEGWSPLLRTVHSVVNRSPPEFLEEVLLVDDYSDKEHLKGPLEDYIRQFKGKVRLIRNKEREGLIRTRSNGAVHAKGKVILFLDAHCEVNINWLPPLLTPIYLDRTVMTVPVIDGIDKDTLEYRPVYAGPTHFRGIFEWGMLYKETRIPNEEIERRKHTSEPYRSPTHAGGLFAMNREYFLELGAYDPGLLVWGGENFELSFKIWQCGGSILWVPCSRVGHVYRGFMPYSFGNLAKKKKGPLITLNYKRVVEVWMDEYKEYFYTREPLAQFLDAGDIREQMLLKKRLGCKSFDWFIKNVAFDVLESFPKLPRNLFWGELRHLVSNECLDSMGSSPPKVVGLSHCHGMGSNQLFRLNAEGQLGVGERCIDSDNSNVKLEYCRQGTVDGPWQYDEKSMTLYHKLHRKCVALVAESNQLKLATCNSADNAMKWRFRIIHPKY
uniref:Polypeptide N-acetylgalactosaminyltransferase n=1 Tax=Strigamia maritima TaxID=126957 RepID=T1JGF0_STRMM